MTDKFLDWSIDNLLYDTFYYLGGCMWGRLLLVFLWPLLLPYFLCVVIGLLFCIPYDVIRWIIKG